MSDAAAARQEGPLALICGGGSLPLAVANLVVARGRQVVLFPLRGAADPKVYAQHPHEWIYVGQVGRFVRLARAAGCRDVVLLGSLVRPAFWQLRLDLKTFMVLPQVAASYRGGDDHLLKGVSRVFERHGFRLLGAHEVAPEILMPAAVLGRVQPSERDQADIALGIDYLRATGPYDVGQAAVVAGKHVLAVEAVEGTDGMLGRVAELRASGRIRAPAGSGVLVKAPKRGQDLRFDMPSIGPRTVEGVVRARLAGIAVAAGETIVAEPSLLVRAADSAKIFVVGTPTGRKS